VTAAGAAGCGTTAAGGSPGRTGQGLSAAALGNKPAWGHQFGYFFTVTGGAIRFFAAKHQVFKILVAFFTMIFVDRHRDSPGFI